MFTEVTIEAPATVANLVCGFDILGMALASPADRMTLHRIEAPEVRIRHTDGFGLPEEAVRNVAGVVLQSVLAKGIPGGFELVIHKQILPGSGIGSSAASAAGAAVAANCLLGEPFSKEELVVLAMEGEFLASGARHADNIAPCIYGGITLVRHHEPPDIIPLPYPDMMVAVVHPQLEVRTADARRILRQQVALKDAVVQWANVAGLVAGLYRGDLALIGRSLEDIIIEPVRKILIPGFDRLKARCLAAGALGGGISGSGPSVFMLCENEEKARAVEQEMRAVYRELNVPVQTHCTRIASQGVRILHQQ